MSGGNGAFEGTAETLFARYKQQPYLWKYREAYHKILERFSLRGKNIECIYSEDWATSDDYHRIMAHWNMHSIPQFLLINRDGIIVDYGGLLRPSNPQTVVKIDALLK
ncbi:MAG: hypothetical protein ACLSFW_07570 [Bacteroides cellulosilyticus]